MQTIVSCPDHVVWAQDQLYNNAWPHPPSDCVYLPLFFKDNNSLQALNTDHDGACVRIPNAKSALCKVQTIGIAREHSILSTCRHFVTILH